MKKIIVVGAFVLFIGVVGCMKTIGENSRIEYPEGYRGWTHVKSMIIQPGHPLENPFQGIHHIYGNEKAVEGYKTGKYQDGSVIVFDLLNYTEADKTIQESDRKLVGMMQKDSSRFSSTGGWGFEGFAADSKTQRLVTDGGQNCFSCHQSVKENDYVFSKWRE